MLTPEEFKEELIKHRNSQKASLRNNKDELAKMISRQLNLELEQIDCNAISEQGFVQACSEGVIAGCKAYYKNYGYPAEFEKHRYPWPAPLCCTSCYESISHASSLS